MSGYDPSAVCARYWGSDGTLCSTHNRRFASDSAMQCEPTAPVQTLADLIAEVAAEHYLMDEDAAPGDEPYICGVCAMPWKCPPARLAAALSVENVAAGLRDAETNALCETYDHFAVALLAAITVAE